MIYDECEQKINTNAKKNKLNERKKAELEASIDIDLKQIENLIINGFNKKDTIEDPLAIIEGEKKEKEKYLKNNKIEIDKKENDKKEKERKEEEAAKNIGKLEAEAGKLRNKIFSADTPPAAIGALKDMLSEIETKKTAEEGQKRTFNENIEETKKEIIKINKKTTQLENK